MTNGDFDHSLQRSANGGVHPDDEARTKTVGLLAIAVVALAGLVGCAATKPRNASPAAGLKLSTENDAAVRATLAELDKTWKNHNRKGFHDLFAEDVLWILRNENAWRDTQIIYKYHEFDDNELPRRGQRSCD